jgi:hypothetical protein
MMKPRIPFEQFGEVSEGEFWDENFPFIESVTQTSHWLA